jgi:hypothetical protein
MTGVVGSLGCVDVTVADVMFKILWSKFHPFGKAELSQSLVLRKFRGYKNK